jgi:hypothetical protein
MSCNISALRSTENLDNVAARQIIGRLKVKGHELDIQSACCLQHFTPNFEEALKKHKTAEECRLR